MKKNKFLLVAMAALMMFSCQKEKGTDDPVPPGNEAKLSINFVQASSDETKVADDDLPALVAKNAAVFIFRTDGSKDATPIYSADLTNITGTVTTQAEKVVVIANCGDITVAGHPLKDVGSYSDLYSRYASLTTGTAPTTDPSSQTVGVFMSDVADVTATNPSDRTMLTAAVTLKAISSSVTLSWAVDLTEVKKALPDASVTINSIEILNAGGKTHYVPSVMKNPADHSLMPARADRKYYGGFDITNVNDFAFPNAAAIVNTGLLHQAVTNQASASNKNYFYIFENDDDQDHQTIALIKATWKNTTVDPGTVTYYPVHFIKKTTAANQFVVRAQNYEVTLAIKNIGVPDPTVPPEASSLSVTVNTTPWNKVTISKEFK